MLLTGHLLVEVEVSRMVSDDFWRDLKKQATKLEQAEGWGCETTPDLSSIVPS